MSIKRDRNYRCSWCRRWYRSLSPTSARNNISHGQRWILQCFPVCECSICIADGQITVLKSFCQFYCQHQEPSTAIINSKTLWNTLTTLGIGVRGISGPSKSRTGLRIWEPVLHISCEQYTCTLTQSPKPWTVFDSERGEGMEFLAVQDSSIGDLVTH